VKATVPAINVHDIGIGTWKDSDVEERNFGGWFGIGGFEDERPPECWIFIPPLLLYIKKVLPELPEPTTNMPPHLRAHANMSSASPSPSSMAWPAMTPALQTPRKGCE
jgi:hypothetical protein